MKKPTKLNKKRINTEINNLKKKYSIGSLYYSFIKLFFKNNQLSLDNLEHLNECSKYKKFHNNDLWEEIKNKYDSFSLKDLEAVFESVIDIERKKAEGAVYTPDYIIDYIIDYSLNIYKGINLPIICDPCCGSGGFLVRAIKILSKKYNISLENSIEYIRGIDINEQSVSCAKIIIELYYLTENILIKSLDKKIICTDTLLTDKNEILHKLELKDGIDILSTNPPYVKLQNIEKSYREKLITKYPLFTNGSFSYAMLFLIAGEKLLTRNGILGYITQNNFFTSIASKSIREYLENKKCIHTIIDFLHTKIFENASAYTCLMFLTNSSQMTSFKFKWALNPQSDLYINDFSNIEVKELNSKKWRLAPKKHLKNIYNIEHIGLQLGEVADIKVGFATLKDAVFLLEQDNNLDLEKDILKSAIKIAELENEQSITNKKRKIIFPYKKINNKFIPYEEDEFIEKFPKTYKYLLDNKEILKTRSQGKNKLKNFYEWGRTQGMQSSSYKLLTKTFSNSPNFMLDTSNSLFCNGYSVKPKSENSKSLYDNEINILILQKILNSSIMDYYSKITSFQLDGNYQCFQKNFIELFNIPILNEENKKFIQNNSGEKLNIYLSDLYNIDYSDIKEIINR